MINDQDHEVHLEGIHCKFAIARPAPGVLVLRIVGWDTGELGDAPRQQLARDLSDEQPVELFVDAREVRGASVDVSGEWSIWFSKNRTRFSQINMLTGSPFIQLTANFVRRFADLGQIMRIYTEAGIFDAALAEAIERQTI